MGLLNKFSGGDSQDKDVIFEIYHDGDKERLNYNLNVGNPVQLISLINLFKEEIIRCEEIISRLDAEEMYDKRMEEFDMEELRETYQDKDSILGLKFQ